MPETVAAAPELYVTDGTIQSMVRSGNTLYIGGTFDNVGPVSPYGTSLDATTGTPNLAFARPNGTIESSLKKSVIVIDIEFWR